MLRNPANKLYTDVQRERKIAEGQRKREELWQLLTSLEFKLDQVRSGHSDQATAATLNCYLAARGMVRMQVPPRASATN